MKIAQSIGHELVSPPAIVFAAYCLIGLAWLGGNPLGTGPDEADHYIKAVAAGQGQPVGNKLPPHRWPTTVEAFAWSNVRAFGLPKRLMPPADIECTKSHPEWSAACQKSWTTEAIVGSGSRTSDVGNYQPYLYFLPGLFARTGQSAWSGMMLARLANLLLSLVFIGMALTMLWDRTCGALSLAGLLVAVTPMSLFLFALVNTNGPEVAGAIGLTSGLMALSRREESPYWYWSASAAGGAVLALGRATGIGFTILITATAALLCDWDGAKQRWRSGGRWAVWSAAIVVTAMAAGFTWELMMHSHPVPSMELALRAAWPIVENLVVFSFQQVGLFGWLDTPMPQFAYTVWLSLVIAVAGLAFVVGSSRQRLALTAAIVSFFACEEFIGAVVLPPTGFGLQGRHALPIAVAIPIVAGEILRANSPKLWMMGLRPLGAVIGGTVGFLQWVGWYANAHRYAVGINGRWVFFEGVHWSPSGGWSPWMVLAAAGSLGIAVYGIIARRPPGPEPSESSA